MDPLYLGRVLRAWFLHTIGRREAAIPAYEEAFRVNPRSLLAASSLGFLAADRKQFRDAERWFRAALDIQPGHAALWFNLGYVLESDGRRQEAVNAFREAVRLSPEMDRAWYGMGLALAKLGDHAGAAESFRKATELQPMNAVAWYQLGMAHQHCNAPEEVEKVIRHLASFDPRHCRLLIAHSERGDLEHLLEGRG